LDLGIAKMREIAGVDTQGNTALTTAGQVLGTPYYMSPEQWGEIPRDGNVEIDGRADIYSLGLVFYEMIAGRRCFAGTTLHELRREHVSRTAKPLHEVVPDVPRGFSEAIQRATAKDRADRQSTARQLAAELRAGLGKAAGNVQPGATDFVRPAAADTVGVGLDTKSDLNAPTLVAMNGAASRPPAIEHAQSDVSETLVDVAAQEPKGTSPTLAASPSMTGSSSVPHLGSGVTLEQEPTTGHVIPAKSSRKIGLVIGLGLAFVFLFVVAIAVIFLISRKHSDTSIANTSKNAGNINKTTEPETRPREIARYWLELEPRSAKESPTLVAGMVPIASGQSLKLHFVFNEPGFVYIFGPGGDNNQPTAFLTNKPFPDSGLKSNEAKRGVDFSFPDGGGRLTLDTRAGTDVFTIIFSRLPLSSPAFLDAQVTGKPLKEAERTELTQFLQKYRQTTPSTELDETDLKAPFVKVNFAPTRDVTAEDTNPFVFDIRIQHN
jgi:serine/threonine protein kinase